MEGKRFCAFDEAKSTEGLDSEVVKLFASGGGLLLRKNHDPESHYAAWGHAMKNTARNQAPR